MIREFDGVFLLETAATAYLFRVLPTGHLQHIWYGKKLELGLDAVGEDPQRQKELVHAAAEAMAAKFANANGCSVVYDKTCPALTMNDLALEVSGPGTGDFRSSAVEVVFADGTRTVDLIFEKAEVLTGASVTDSGVVFQYTKQKLKGAVYNVYAGADIKAADGRNMGGFIILEN